MNETVGFMELGVLDCPVSGNRMMALRHKITVCAAMERAADCEREKKPKSDP